MIINKLPNKMWLLGISELVQMLDDPQRYGPSYICKVIAGVATPAAMGQVARTIDPTQRETNTVGDAIRTRVPGLSDNLMPKLDVRSEPIVKDGGVGPDIVSPFYLSNRDHKLVNEEALRLGLKVTVPTRDVGGKRLSNEDYHAYREQAGKLTANAFATYLASNRRATDNEKRQAFDKIKAATRKQARGELFGGSTSLTAGSVTSRPQLKPLPPLPLGYAIAPR